MRYSLRLRFFTTLPLCNTLFQRLRCCPTPPLFIVHYGIALFAFYARAEICAIAIFPTGALASFSGGFSGFIANGIRRLTFSAANYTADSCTTVRAIPGRGRNRRLRKLIPFTTTRHRCSSFRGCRSVARSLRRYRFFTHSFRQAAPRPTYAQTALFRRSLVPFYAASIADYVFPLASFLYVVYRSSIGSQLSLP